MLNLPSQISEAADYVRQRWTKTPRVGIILGTGLGNLADHINAELRLDYQAIPHFPQSTALGHKGQLVCGHLSGVPVVTMEGRFHLYSDQKIPPPSFYWQTSRVDENQSNRNCIS